MWIAKEQRSPIWYSDSMYRNGGVRRRVYYAYCVIVKPLQARVKDQTTATATAVAATFTFCTERTPRIFTIDTLALCLLSASVVCCMDALEFNSSHQKSFPITRHPKHDVSNKSQVDGMKLMWRRMNSVWWQETNFGDWNIGRIDIGTFMAQLYDVSRCMLAALDGSSRSHRNCHRLDALLDDVRSQNATPSLVGVFMCDVKWVKWAVNTTREPFRKDLCSIGILHIP